MANAPITYGPAPNTPMTSANSMPGMAVWLFLVTNPNFLTALDVNDTSTVPVNEIATATNLTPQCVQGILNCYKANSNTNVTQAFHTVATAFQVYARAAGYPPSACPQDANPILTLAKSGAAV